MNQSSSHRAAWIRANLWGLRPFRRHSLVLLVAGLAYMFNGFNYIFAPLTENRRVALALALEWFPIEFWGSLFVLFGVLTVISSRWPKLSETWGYMLLGGLSAGWSATFAVGVIFGESPASNFTGALQWGLLAFLWWAIPGFVNPEKTVVVVITDNDQGTDRR